MTTLWDDVGLFAGKPEAEGERLETDGTLVVVVWGEMGGDDGEGGHWGGGVGMDVAVVFAGGGCGGSGIGGVDGGGLVRLTEYVGEGGLEGRGIGGRGGRRGRSGGRLGG